MHFPPVRPTQTKPSKNSHKIRRRKSGQSDGFESVGGKCSENYALCYLALSEVQSSEKYHPLHADVFNIGNAGDWSSVWSSSFHAAFLLFVRFLHIRARDLIYIHISKFGDQLCPLRCRCRLGLIFSHWHSRAQTFLSTHVNVASRDRSRTTVIQAHIPDNSATRRLGNHVPFQ